MNKSTLVTLIGVVAVAVAPRIAGAQAQVPPAAAPPVAAPAPAASPGAAPAPGQPDLAGVTVRDLPERAIPELEGITPEPGGLTAAEVARRALAVSPSVKDKRAQVDAANEQITQTMLAFF